jgi:orotate phosphoribosyltransferase
MNYPIEFKEVKNDVIINFNIKKFGTKYLDLFSHLFYKFLNNKRRFIFNLSNLEWIAHEELVYLSAIFDQLYQNNIDFKINLKNETSSIRQAKSLIYLWESWQIFSFLPQNIILKQIEKYFDLTNIQQEDTKKTLQVFFDIDDSSIDHFIDNLLRQIEQNNNTSDICSKFFDISIEDINELKQTYLNKNDIELESNIYKITPFVKLSIPKGALDEQLISKNLDKIYKLDIKTQNLLESHSSNTPFLNKSLSSIISKELYENSIEHAYEVKRVKNPSCYLSVTLKNKIYEDGAWSNEEIDSFNKINFEQEAIKEMESFYKVGGSFKNQSLLQFTFLDFGSGIPSSLKKQVQNTNRSKDESDILEYSFNYESSRFPLSEKYLEKNNIPRGLFDVLSIVRRYKGLLIIRSNYGKLIYDFSQNKTIDESAIKYDKSNTKFFNGTIITILIPENNFGIELKAIKPQYLVDAANKTKYYLNILEVQKAALKKIRQRASVILEKKLLYNETLDSIALFLDNKQSENCTVIMDFNGCNLEPQVSKKIMFFLATDYRINEKTNVIVFNFPDKELILEIQLEILNSPKEKQSFIYHPIPCVFYNHVNTEVIWIGISEKVAYEKLNNVFYSIIHNESLADFEDKKIVTESGMFHYDEHGNIKTLIGIVDDQCIFSIVEKARKKSEDSIYLCSGNYYQYEYIELLEQLYDREETLSITNLLHKRIQSEQSTFYNDVTHIISITLSSQLIAGSFISQLDEEISNRIIQIKLSNYHSYHLEDDFINKIHEGDRVIVICDVISTGYLIKSLKEKLEAKEAFLHAIISIVDTRTKSNRGSIEMFYEDTIPTFVLSKTPIDKYTRSEIENISSKKIIRINPVTNTQITLEANKSEYKETVLMNEDDFLGLIDFPADYIKIGYYNYNKLFHPYFFDTKKLFKSHNGTKILKFLIDKIYDKINTKIDYIFYPIFSGAEEVNSYRYKNEVFKNEKIEFIPLARFNTTFGWRFTFPPKFLNSKTSNSNILVLDDGSCTGATIIQMIDEISFLNVNSITLLSVIGRTDDYLREFYSRIKTIKVKHLSDSLTELFSFKENLFPDNKVPLNIFFGSQWHVPTYSISSSFPFINEQTQLNYLLNLDNLPSILTKYVIKRIAKLNLTTVDDKSEIKYLPKTNGKLPILELLSTRNQIGKINGYRFYKDYFDDFNIYVEDYYNKVDDAALLKKTELYLSVLLHEPYIIQSLQDFLPDFYQVLLEITGKVINNFDNSQKPNFQSLNFEWERASWVSIYLNLRKNRIREVLSEDNLNSLLSFISLSNNQNSLKIFLMYVLNYIPISKSDLSKQESGIYCLKELAKYLNKEIPSVDPFVYSNLRLFKSFLNTIPFLDKDLKSKRACLDKTIQFFIDEKSVRLHDISLEKQLGIIKTQSKLIPFSEDLFSNEVKVDEIKKAWNIILPRLEQFQRYANRLEGFFEVFQNGIINYHLSRSEKNFKKIVLEISEMIESNRVVDNWSIIFDYSKNLLLENFFSEKSFLSQLFLYFDVQDVPKVWEEIMGEKITEIIIDNTEKEIIQIKALTIEFPLLYLKEVVFTEICNNFRYCTENEPINVHWKIEGDKLRLSIKNKIGHNGKKGGKNGFQNFKLLKNILEFDFPEPTIINEFFFQEYIFKIK